MEDGDARRGTGRDGSPAGGSWALEAGAGRQPQASAAADAALAELETLVDADELAGVARAQEHTLECLQNARAVLEGFTAAQAGHRKAVAPRLAAGAKALKEVRRDLKQIHKRAATLRSKLAAAHPEAFAGLPSQPPWAGDE